MSLSLSATSELVSVWRLSVLSVDDLCVLGLLLLLLVVLGPLHVLLLDALLSQFDIETAR
jgi:hypothetical protein